MIDYLKLVKFSHTIFALPFALVGFFLGVMKVGSFDFVKMGLVLLCMVFARNAAMSFNRWADQEIDGKNERTAGREIPAGILPSKSVLWFSILNVILFIVTCYFINPLCFYLSPIAILVVLGYSYSKRFTSLAHFVLGAGLALAPIGAYLAITGTFDWIPVLYSLAVFTWVAGFDIIYALQDESFDVNEGLHSIPARLGARKALILSMFIHTITVILLSYAGYLCTIQFEELGYLCIIGTLIFLALILYQHTLVKYNDLSKVNMAFFQTNGIASVLFGVFFILDVYL